MAKFVNVTPHSINFRSADGTEYEVPPSGVVLNAKFVDEDAGTRNGVALVRTKIEAEPSSLDALAKLEEENPGAVFVGSLIAAQAFPSRVVSMIASPGYERKPPAEKRMRDDKFTTF